MSFLKNFGRLPAEYNEKVHGPYDPSRFYGKKDIPFGEVKVGELGSWLARRNKSPAAVAGACSRAFWRWQFKYVLPKRSGLTPIIQFVCGTMALFYVINYEHLRYHIHYKHHW
ncbi:putative ATP synthase subunit f, mitochondrial [Uloborus diversus]|uniref:putative ATP synthase subunit f, mitochondrial n=1 Tax=Uloborus diversus TaxID=327109 RepID=UPI002409691F|nr:putative ATP synthase subunit f, mitochondrial [Uloborus diversus]